MKLKALFEDDGAVSPVIGVILMVAITVILAAVIGTFVLGLGKNVTQQSPTATFSMDFDNDGTVLITHTGGDTIKKSSQLSVTDTSGDNSATWDKNVSAGDSFDYCNEGNTQVEDNNCSASGWDGQTVRVIWQTQTGGTSTTLAEQQAPA